jgi:hypothetical protein
MWGAWQEPQTFKRGDFSRIYSSYPRFDRTCGLEPASQVPYEGIRPYNIDLEFLIEHDWEKEYLQEES